MQTDSRFNGRETLQLNVLPQKLWESHVSLLLWSLHWEICFVLGFLCVVSRSSAWALLIRGSRLWPTHLFSITDFQDPELYLRAVLCYSSLDR